MLGIIGFVLTVGIIVVIHEWGHYIVARMAGVKILAFSFGFGKVLLKRTDKRGCEWRLSMWPLGGYVKMLDTAEKEDHLKEGKTFSEADWANAFDRKSVWRRFAVVFAGPAMNLILAALIYAALAMLGTYEPSGKMGVPPAGTQAYELRIDAGDSVTRVADVSVKTRNAVRMEFLNHMGEADVPATVTTEGGVPRTVRFDLSAFHGDGQTDPLEYLGLMPYTQAVVVAEVIKGGAAEAAGLARGDTVLTLDGKPVTGVQSMITAIRAKTGKTLEMRVKNPEGVERTVVTEVRPEDVNGQTIGRIGASLGSVGDFVFEHAGPVDALGIGGVKVWDTIRLTVNSVAGMLSGNVSVKSISGPVAIGDMAGQTLQYGFVPYVLFLALISISIGVLNLLPVPVLDGGHLMFYLYEMVTGRKPAPQVAEWGQKIGVFLLLLLMVLAVGNDITRLFGLN